MELVDARPPNSQRRDVPLLPLEVDVGLCLSQPPPLPPRNLGSDTDRMPLPGSMTEEPAEQASELDGEPMFGAGVLVSLKASSAGGLLCCIVQSTSSAFQNAVTFRGQWDAEATERDRSEATARELLSNQALVPRLLQMSRRQLRIRCWSSHLSCRRQGNWQTEQQAVAAGQEHFALQINECPRRESCSSQKHHR